jgi:hypothetical protein
MAEKKSRQKAFGFSARYSCFCQPAYHLWLPVSEPGSGRHDLDTLKAPILSICNAFFVKDNVPADR